MFNVFKLLFVVLFNLFCFLFKLWDICFKYIMFIFLFVEFSIFKFSVSKCFKCIDFDKSSKYVTMIVSVKLFEVFCMVVICCEVGMWFKIVWSIKGVVFSVVVRCKVDRKFLRCKVEAIFGNDVFLDSRVDILFLFVVSLWIWIFFFVIIMKILDFLLYDRVLIIFLVGIERFTCGRCRLSRVCRSGL